MKKILFLSLWIITSLAIYAQQGFKITGKVRDAKTGENLIGVNVVIKGTTNGTITDINGNYNLTVPNRNVVLKFSYVGYSELEEPVRGRNAINVQLSDEGQKLSEVVVVGYGVQKKQSLIGSISSIDNKSLVTAPASNISQSLAGKLSGIQVVQTSGELGNDVADIYVRGMATWNDATPLIVVDGIVRSEFAKIDPNEIASINILKDASATAVFGVKGANGVIIITTKRGIQGKPKVSITAQTAITEPVRIPEPLGAYDAMSLKYLQDWGQNNTRSPRTKGGTLAYDLALWRTGASPWTHPDVRWVDEVMKDYSTQQQYNVNISGGGKTVRYFVSGGFLNQDGFYKKDPYSSYSRFNFRSNLDFEISKNLTASLSVGSRIENLSSPQSTAWSSWNIYRGAFAYSGRDYPIYNPDGSYGGNGSNIMKQLTESGKYDEVKSTLESSYSLVEKLDFITKGLSAKAQASFDTQALNSRAWTKNAAEYVYTQATDSYQKFQEDTPLSYSGNPKNSNWNKFYLEGGLMYDRTFGKHSFTGLFLANRNELIRNNEVAYADQGLVGRTTYDYRKRYFGEVNVGYNGSENFPKKMRYGFFPAFSLGWLVSNEDFISNTKLGDIITNLKLRASLGWVGNDKLSIDNIPRRFLFLQQFNNAGGYTFGTGENYYNGIRQGDIANTDVTWEVARKLNVGFESEFYKGLLGINVDYFFENRQNILTIIDEIKPQYVGANFEPANIGETENKGIEIEVKHNLRINKDFSYSIKGNFTYNRNKILKKTDPEGFLPYQKSEGYPIGTLSTWKSLGYFNSYEEIQNSPSQLGAHNGLTGNVEVVPGDLKFLDFNNDGVINENDAYRQGYGRVPELQYGLTLSFNWKEFDFSTLLQGSAHSAFPKNWEIMWPFSNSDNVFEKHNNYWAPEISDVAQSTRFYGKSWINNERYYSTYEIGSGTYLKMKSIEVGYTIPKRLSNKLKISNARIYLSSLNTFLWAKEKYLDPDNRNDRGGLMPPTRAYNVGLNLNF